MRWIIAMAAILAASAALGQLLTQPVGPGSIYPIGPSTNSSGSGPPPPTCTADGKTDWSSACDIPMGVALGVL